MRSGKTFIIAILAIMFLGMAGETMAQKVAFISSDVIRENLPDAKAAEQRLQSIVEEWKREMEVLEHQPRLAREVCGQQRAAALALGREGHVQAQLAQQQRRT